MLAVVSATSDFQVQSIGHLMRSSEIAQRTMGLGTVWTQHARSQGFTFELLQAAHVLDRAEAYYEVSVKAHSGPGQC